MLRRIIILLFLAVFILAARAQRIASFEVPVTKHMRGWHVPVSINLDDVTNLSADDIALMELRGQKATEVTCQVLPGKPLRLYWIMTPSDNSAATRKYELVKKRPAKKVAVETPQKDGTLTIRSGNRDLLRYQFEMVYPPAGVDSAFKRNAFIHPLWSPHGQVLTRIQPPDHYHHYGIWNPWTHVLYKNDTVDFWNIGGKKGTVRFAGFTTVNSGPVFGQFEARHDHVVFKKDGEEEVAIKELQSVTVYHPTSDYYIADIDIQLSCATDSPVKLLEYRYGGLGWRTTEKWDRYNSEAITSAGKTRKDADGSKATWCIVQGEIDNDYAGVVMMSHPANYNHPEPLRIWPENQYNRGDMFANFSPTKDKDWLLEPGKTYTLKYRLLVFNGKFTKENAESAWQQFANIAPVVKR